MSTHQPAPNAENDGRFLRIESMDKVLVVSPLFTFAQFSEPDLLNEWNQLKSYLEQSPVTQVVVDLAEIPYFGSTVLGWMVQIWKKMRERGGTLTMCNVSPIGREILAAAKFDELWNVHDTRAEALKMLPS